MSASRPSEHLLVRGEIVQTFRWEVFVEVKKDLPIHPLFLCPNNASNPGVLATVGSGKATTLFMCR